MNLSFQKEKARGLGESPKNSFMSPMTLRIMLSLVLNMKDSCNILFA